MLHVRHFKPEEWEDFNKFRETHIAREGDKSGAFVINESGFYFFYEGSSELYDKQEQIAWLYGQIRTYKAQVLQSEPMLRIARAQNEDAKNEIAANLEQIKSLGIDKTHSKQVKDIEKTNQKLEGLILGNENAILISERNVENARNQVIALTELLKEIKEGKFVI